MLHLFCLEMTVCGFTGGYVPDYFLHFFLKCETIPSDAVPVMVSRYWLC